MKVLLVGNYFPDRQHSMQRFAAMLRDGLRAQGHEVRLIRPRPVLARRLRGLAKVPSAGKWLAYIDKYLLFPRTLRRAARWADVVHVCDHSNAMYANAVAHRPHVVTCHDLLAVRGALGEATDCPATATGKLLQRWILRSLKRAQAIACVSSATRHDLIRLGGEQVAPRSQVIMLGVASTLAAGAEQALPIRAGRKFLLNVGSNLKRKNRDGAMRIFRRVAEKLDCDLVFAGEPLSRELKQLKEQIGLNGNVIEVPRPSDGQLQALYAQAFALLYPTKYEGFGWPAIEAQQNGCPVISSQSTSIPEVVGNSALLRAPDDEEGFATAVLELTEERRRADLVARGFQNVKRFTPERMVNDYIALYQELCARN
jgi:glycosyltransferase involved in cell wall biosynthesis